MKSKKTNPRDSFRAFMEERKLKPHPWAQKAGVRSSTLYNYLAGKSASLSSDTLQKLARAANSTVDELLGLVPPNSMKEGAPTAVRVVAVVGIYGKVFEVEMEERVERPAGLPEGVDVLAARIDKDGLHPLPQGWLVFYEEQPREPQSLLSKLAVVKPAGSSQRMIREIRKGSTAGLYTLAAWNASPLEDVEIESAHAVLSISQPVEPVSRKK